MAKYIKSHVWYDRLEEMLRYFNENLERTSFVTGYYPVYYFKKINMTGFIDEKGKTFYLSEDDTNGFFKKDKVLEKHDLYLENLKITLLNIERKKKLKELFEINE